MMNDYAIAYLLFTLTFVVIFGGALLTSIYCFFKEEKSIIMGAIILAFALFTGVAVMATLNVISEFPYKSPKSIFEEKIGDSILQVKKLGNTGLWFVETYEGIVYECTLNPVICKKN